MEEKERMRKGGKYKERRGEKRKGGDIGGEKKGRKKEREGRTKERGRDKKEREKGK